MIVKQITLTDLRRMNGKEGLILQGCGGETQEWVDGINEMLRCSRVTALPVFSIPLKMSTLTSASWQCGDYSPIQPLQECGCPTMWTTGWVVLNLNRTKKKSSNPTVH